MQTAQIIPFKFEACEVRTLLIDDQPWFVAADVCRVLDVTNASQAMQALDEDERSMFNIGRQGQANIINESGMYTLILRCRDAVKKGSKPHAFRKWITAEVLPAIRKHGSYADTENKMGTLIGETIGTNGFNMLGALIKGKVVSLPAQTQRKATAKIWSQTHAAFGVRSAADIPASQLDAARNFIAAYALEGEWLGRDEKAETLFALDFPRAQDLSLLLHYTAWVMHRWNKSIRAGLKELNPELYSSTWEFFMEAQRAAQRLDKSMPELVAYFQKENGGKRPEDLTLSARAAQA